MKRDWRWKKLKVNFLLSTWGCQAGDSKCTWRGVSWGWFDWDGEWNWSSVYRQERVKGPKKMRLKMCKRRSGRGGPWRRLRNAAPAGPGGDEDQLLLFSWRWEEGRWGRERYEVRKRLPSAQCSYMSACTRACALHEGGRERNARMRTLITQ